MAHIHIRRLHYSDADQLSALANNKKVWDNLRDYIPFPYTKKDGEAFIKHTLEEDPEQTFAITICEELCGIIGLVLQSDVYRLSAEVGYWIGEKYWGRGIATKAVKLISDYGFEKLKLERLHAGIFEGNHASMVVLEKNCFQKEGVFRNAVVKNGNILNEHRYALLKAQHSTST